MSKPTYYEQFEISDNASPEMIHAAYKVLAKKFHPDLCGLPKEQAEAIMKEINAIYATLSDPEKRKRYDQYLRNKREETTAKANESATQSSEPKQSPTPSQQPKPKPQISNKTFWKVLVLLGVLPFATLIYLASYFSNPSNIPAPSHKPPVETSPPQVSNNDPQIPKYTPEDEPYNGRILSGYERGKSSITVITNPKSACVVKLKTIGGEEILSFYVKAGSRATVNVPSQKMYVYFASGKTWYGSKYLFGDDTYYSMDETICDFSNYTYEYTLYEVYDGNFSEKPISADEFK
jgi:curved DNA-binding protein CbpA